MPVSRNMLRPAVMLGVAAVLFFTKLGLAHVWDEDEAIFAEISREMFELGDWIVPRFNGKVFVDKPVMMYWLMMAGYSVFGTTEFGARCASALVGLGTVWITYLIGRRLFSERVGFWAGLILSSGVYFNVISRAATPDIELVFCCTLAMYAFVRSMGWNSSEDDGRADVRPRSG
ncbi:MAG TPA: glycosyltransferase family 39 protein, partial [Planctomycetaceae bacterium]|nr:glycosyltransferase family 39 protein [Planctomycetaceae bacterium]